MATYDSTNNSVSALKLMGSRLGVFSPAYAGKRPYDNEGQQIIDSILHEDIVAVNNQRVRLQANGGNAQQERMIFDKRRSLDRAVLYSYQGALIKKVEADEKDLPMRALINPDKNKFDYDDKILSVGFEYNIKPGDVFEWVGTNTYWLVDLQDLTELAYFRGNIRRCSYEIQWEDDGLHSTYVAVRGPVETKIDFIQKHLISVDEPNHSLHILMPRNESTLRYFKRYSKFYLKGQEDEAPKICWRVEATDWISTPGILELTAVEYYANETEDDIDAGLVGALVIDPISPNTNKEEEMIVGETFIKPKNVFEYHFEGVQISEWKVDKECALFNVNPNDPKHIKLKWDNPYSGQFTLSYGKYSKTIVVESFY